VFVLDTNVVSELRKAQSGKADANVESWARRIDAGQLYVSAITILELEMGVLHMEMRDATQGAILRAWFTDRVLPEFSERVLPIDIAVARRCAQLHVPNRMAERDALIAATALVHRMTIVTRDAADFLKSGVAVINPWEATR
jgi:predicted nucleic acid-binding protein